MPTNDQLEDFALSADALAKQARAWKTITPPVTTPPVTTPPTSKFQLAITEDFTDGKLSKNFWPFYDGSAGTAGVGERKGSLATFRDGALVLACERPAGSTDWNQWFSTGAAMGPAAQTYGRWEIEALASKMGGSWPNIQLWPTAGKQPAKYNGKDGWPNTIEVDIAESPEADRKTVHATIHYGAGNSTVSASLKVDVTQDHIYACEWTPDYLAIFVDGKPMMWTVDGKTSDRLTDPKFIPTTPHHLVVQTDMGSWAGKPGASDPTRMELVVNSIKQYKYVG